MSVKTRTRVAIAAILAGVATAVVVAPASANIPNLVGYYSGVAGTTALGTMLAPDFSEREVCIDSISHTPTTKTDPYLDSSHPEIAYLMEKWAAQDTDDTRAAALALMVKRAYDSNVGEADATLAMNYFDPYRSGILADVAEMASDASANAGPYTSSPTLHVTNLVPTTGTAGDLGIQSAAGNYQAGYTLTVTLSGPAVFDSTGTSTASLTTTTAAQSLTWHATGAGQIDVSTSAVTPSASVKIYPPEASGYQRLLVAPDSTTVNGQDPIDVAVNTVYTPTVTTNTTSILVNAGASLADVVHVTKAAPDAAFDGTTVLCGPFATEAAAAASAPAGAPVVGTATFSGTTDANGAATVTSSTLATVGSGYYTWVETLNQMNASDGTVLSAPVTGTFGVSSETTLSYAPKITTKISSTLAIVGSKVTDTATASGIQTSVGGKTIVNTLTGMLVGPVAALKDANGALTCTGVDYTGAPVAVKIPATPVTKDGDITGLGAFTFPSVGCFSYGETLTWSVTGGAPTDSGTYLHPVGQVTQTVLVTEPAMSTTASQQVSAVGQPLTDTVIVTGTNGAAGTIYPTLFGPMLPANGSCKEITDAMWRAAITAGTVVGVDAPALEVSGDGTVVTAEVTPTAPGCHHWYESAEFVNGTSTPTVVKTPLGVSAETTLVLAPAITTVASKVGQDGDFIDTITLTGTFGAPGTITGLVYGPMPSADGTCTDVTWAGAPEFAAIAPIATTGDGTYVTKTIIRDAKGCYTFAEVWTSADNKTVVANSGAGQVSETLYFSEGRGGNGINTGLISDSGAPTALVVLGSLVMLAGVGGLVVAARRRREAATV